MKLAIKLVLFFIAFNTLHATANSFNGLWVGVFSYNDTEFGNTEPFSIVFKQDGDLLKGKVIESVTGTESNEIAFYSNITGFISGQSVLFTKQYDGTGGRDHKVTYELTIENPSLMKGVWKINGIVGGKAAILKISSKAIYEYNFDKK